MDIPDSHVGVARMPGEKPVVIFDPTLHPGIVLRCMISGVPEDQIASIIGIPLQLLAKWIRTYPELEQARYEALLADAEVAKSLYDLAVGNCTNSKGEGVAPNVLAAIFWLKCHAGWTEAKPPAAPPKSPRDHDNATITELAKSLLEKLERKSVKDEQPIDIIVDKDKKVSDDF